MDDPVDFGKIASLINDCRKKRDILENAARELNSIFWLKGTINKECAIPLLQLSKDIYKKAMNEVNESNEKESY